MRNLILLSTYLTFFSATPRRTTVESSARRRHPEAVCRPASRIFRSTCGASAAKSSGSTRIAGRGDHPCPRVTPRHLPSWSSNSRAWAASPSSSRRMARIDSGSSPTARPVCATGSTSIWSSSASAGSCPRSNGPSCRKGRRDAENRSPGAAGVRLTNVLWLRRLRRVLADRFQTSAAGTLGKLATTQSLRRRIPARGTFRRSLQRHASRRCWKPIPNTWP